ncbi:hypothetical protein R5R35_003504 [Gryllus longicercus]|jgi:hypothetical protein
MKNL